MEPSDVYREAAIALKAGMSVVPPRQDGTKAPIGSWLRYQKERADREQIDEWYEDGRRQGIGVVTGAISGDLTMLESEDEHIHTLLRDNADATGLGELLSRIEEGWSERTPGGGFHIYYRCSDIRGNKKLARRPDGFDESGRPKVKVLLETRGEGGYTVIAPSGGSTHETGNAYDRLAGGPKTVVTISPEEQRDLWQLCSVFNEVEVKHVPEPTPVGLLRPGDDYNDRTDWREILEPHGWSFVFERQGVWYLRRPGKDRGVSATVNWGGLGLFRNFSSSTPFDERAYTKFGVYTILEHDGDYRAAAKTLAERGYGARDQLQRPLAQGGEEGGGDEDRELVWREPDPLERPGFPTFPIHRFPEEIRSFGKDVATKIQVPTDYPAMTMLSTLSTACRGRWEIGPEVTGYSEPLVLQTVLFAESGTRKSASFAVVKAPLVKHEIREQEKDEIEFKIWEGEVEFVDRCIKKERQSSLPDRLALRGMYEQRAALERARPTVTRLIADDVTPERLGTLIAEQRGPISVMAPEGGFFGNLAGRYSAGVPNLEYVLRGHAGEALIIDRMGREATVPGAYVTLGISLQPSLLDEMAATPGFSGKGMAARLLPSLPTSLVGRRDVRESAPLDPDEARVWHSVVTSILQESREVACDGDGVPIPYRLVLASDARELYYLYAEHVERQLAKGGGLYHMRDWGGKMVGHALRIAGLFHLVEYRAEARWEAVSRSTLADAIAVMEYFVPHAQYMLSRINGESYGAHLDELINAIRGEGTISSSALTAKLKSSTYYRGNRDYIDDALDELELMGYLRLTPGKRGAKIELNPAIEGVATYAGFQVPDPPAGDWSFTLEESDDEDNPW